MCVRRLRGQLDADGDVLFRTVGMYRDAAYDIEQLNNDVRLLAPSLAWQISPDTSLTLLAAPATTVAPNMQVSGTNIPAGATVTKSGARPHS